MLLLPGKQSFQRVLTTSLLLLLLRLLLARVKRTQEGSKRVRGGETPTFSTTTEVATKT